MNHAILPTRGAWAGALLLGLCSLPALAASDPPASGPVGIVAGQSLRMNVFCYPHPSVVGDPQPCSGQLMMHDGTGRTLASAPYNLMPGQSTGLEFALPDARDSTVGLLPNPRRLEIEPCWEPDPLGGIAIPSAEVVDSSTRRTALVVPIVAARLSQLAIPR